MADGPTDQGGPRAKGDISIYIFFKPGGRANQKPEGAWPSCLGPLGGAS
jgi:hypothetical protein